MKKKIILVLLALYLIGGLWFYWQEVKYGRNVWICPHEGMPSSVTREPSLADCQQPTYTLDKEEFRQAAIMITLWLPLVIGHRYTEPPPLDLPTTTLEPNE